MTTEEAMQDTERSTIPVTDPAIGLKDVAYRMARGAPSGKCFARTARINEINNTDNITRRLEGSDDAYGSRA